MTHLKFKNARRNRERMKAELNPCPGRTDTQRQYITRRLLDIADCLNYHLERLDSIGPQPQWLPEAVITPAVEEMYVDARESYEDTPRDEYGYITQMHDHKQRATNRVRIASWYTNPNTGSLYMTAMIAVSPLPCDTWGALPLTLSQWRVIIPEITATHMHWKWVHAVRKYWNDTDYEVGGTFGWHMEKCKKLDRDHSQLWTGQAIYQHVVRQYLEHVELTSGTQCQS